MEVSAFESVLEAGEGIGVEFKRCGSRPFTAADVADMAGCSLRTAQRRLKAMVERGELRGQERSSKFVYAGPQA